MKNIFSSYHQQVQLKVNPNIKFNSKFNTIINNITNLYLDLIIEISLKITNKTNNNKKNELYNCKLIDYKGKKPMRAVLGLKYNKNNSNNYLNYEDVTYKQINCTKSPLIQKKTPIYYDSHTSSNFSYNNYINSYNKSNKKKDSYFDINYNVINNNYLNYIAPDNNNFYIKYNLKNSENNSPFRSVNLEKKHKEKINKNNSFNFNDNRILNQNENFYKDYINKANKKLMRAYNKSVNITEIPIPINKISENKLNDKNYIDLIDSNYKNNINKTSNNHDSFIYNKKKNLQIFFNKRLSQKTDDSPNNKDKIKTNSCCFYDNMSNISEKNDIIICDDDTKKTKKNKRKEMCTVLNYFSYVKPFFRKSVKDTKNIECTKNKENNNKINDLKIEVKNNVIDSINYNDNHIKNNQSKVINFKNNENKITENLKDAKTFDFNSDKIIEFMNDNSLKTKEIKKKFITNYELIKKYYLIKEEYHSLLKIKNQLLNKKNHSEIDYLIHVNINSKLNEKLYLKLKSIKKRELSIIGKVFQGNKIFQTMKKMKDKLEQQKKCHILLKVVRELIQKFENISQIYKDDDNKKLLLKSLLLRYGIREKEESKENNNLVEKFKELQIKIKINRNKVLMDQKKMEIMKDITKNVIKEEDSEECASCLSDVKSKPYYIKKISSCSEDSIAKEKEFFDKTEVNKHNNTPEISYKKEKGILIEENLIDKNSIKKKIEFNDI